MELYPDQQHDIVKLRDAFRRYHSVLFTAPTGYGKTITFSYITSQMHAKRRHVVIAVHRVELVKQVSAALKIWGVPHGILSPSWPYTDHPVQVASVFTLARRMTYFPEPYLLIIDEAHHAIRDSTWGKIMQMWPRAYKLGVTATPIRLDGSGLSDMFETLVLGPTTQELIDNGRLARFKILAPPTIDTAGLHLRAGEFDKREAAFRADRPSITGDVIEHYKQHAPGKRGIAFCVSVEHAHNVSAAFREAGIRSVAVDGKMDGNIRANHVDAFRHDRVSVLASCDLVSEGFDVPGIECGLLLRPTASTGLYLQQFGRCLRVAPGKTEAVVLDHAGNTIRHGWPAADRHWELTTTAENKGKSHAATVRLCLKCYAATRAPAVACSNCGEPFPVEPRQVAHLNGSLEELAPNGVPQRQEQGRTKTLEGLVKLYMVRHPQSHPIKARLWAEHVMAGRRRKESRTVSMEGV